MRTEEEMVAYALETDPSLLPYIPELLVDLDELGSDSELITEVIEDLGLPERASVIDLGCGKGAVATEIADGLGLDVLGLELFEPFVESCQERARSRGVADRCSFISGDILKLAGKLEPADVVVFAALGDVLGRLDETVAIIRQYAKPGGYMVISDVFIRDGGLADYPGFHQYAEHEETIGRLTVCGDTLMREVLEDAQVDDDDGEDESKLIADRAQVIAARHPEVANAALAFAENQAAESDYISENLVGAIWVLKRC